MSLRTETSRQETAAPAAAQTGVCATITSGCSTITSGCSTIASTVRSAGSMAYSGGSFVVSTMCSPIESTNHAIAYAKRKYDLYGQYAPAVVCVVATATAGSTLATLFTSTATVTAAIIGPVTLALASAVYFAAYKFTTYENTKELIMNWSWTAFIPMAGVAWATATPFAAVVAMTVLAAAGIFGMMAVGTFGSEEPESGNMTDEQMRERRDARRAAQDVEQDVEREIARAARDAERQAASAARVAAGGPTDQTTDRREMRTEFQAASRQRRSTSYQAPTSTSRGGYGNIRGENMQ